MLRKLSIDLIEADLCFDKLVRLPCLDDFFLSLPAGAGGLSLITASCTLCSLLGLLSQLLNEERSLLLKEDRSLLLKEDLSLGGVNGIGGVGLDVSLTDRDRNLVSLGEEESISDRVRGLPTFGELSQERSL